MNVKTLLKAMAPVLVIAAGVAGAKAIVNRDPAVETPSRPPVAPLARAVAIAQRDGRASVLSHGTVTAQSDVPLATEVTGSVISASPALADGGFVRQGDVLLRVDPGDFEVAVTEARADVAAARLALTREEAEADVARNEWRELGDGRGTPLSLRVPQIAGARAALAAAEARLQKARRDLERTVVRAPFDCRVHERCADVGQFVRRGETVARVYSVDYVEIRLPLTDAQLARIDLPLDYRGERREEDGPAVTIEGRFAGRAHRWRGRIVRAEGEVDPRTGMVHVVARVRDPFARGDDATRPPLAVGLAVTAEIEGHPAPDAIAFGRSR